MNKIQITEEQAIEMVRALRYNLDILSESKMVEKWKGAGFIKKTALEEARELRDNAIGWMRQMGKIDRTEVFSVFDGYEAAIKELEAVIKELQNENA